MQQTQHLMRIEMVRIGGENAPAKLDRLPRLAFLMKNQGTGKQVGNSGRLRSHCFAFKASANSIAQSAGQRRAGGSVRIAKLVSALLLALAMGLAPRGVHADTRDDVLSAISRCNVIHDNKVWLDCVYGAQQPMRA